MLPSYSGMTQLMRAGPLLKGRPVARLKDGQLAAQAPLSLGCFSMVAWHAKASSWCWHCWGLA